MYINLDNLVLILFRPNYKKRNHLKVQRYECQMHLNRNHKASDKGMTCYWHVLNSIQCIVFGWKKKQWNAAKSHPKFESRSLKFLVIWLDVTVCIGHWYYVEQLDLDDILYMYMLCCFVYFVCFFWAGWILFLLSWHYC